MFTYEVIDISNPKFYVYASPIFSCQVTYADAKFLILVTDCSTGSYCEGLPFDDDIQ